MLHKTRYTLYPCGLPLDVEIRYLHQESAGGNGEFLTVLATEPHQLTQEQREEIELHCWTDVTTRGVLATIEENSQPNLLTGLPVGGASCNQG